MKPFKIYLKGNPLQCLCPSLRFLKWMKQSHIVADVHVLRCVQADGSSQNIVKILRNKYSKARLYLKYSTVNTIHNINTEERVTENGNQYCDKHSLSYDLRFLKIFTIFWLDPSACTHRNTWMGFNLCLDEKTFIVGSPIGENIIQAIDSSRKVIFIITENFLNSTCYFKPHWL
jgi:hypothetical protein